MPKAITASVVVVSVDNSLLHFSISRVRWGDTTVMSLVMLRQYFDLKGDCVHIEIFLKRYLFNRNKIRPRINTFYLVLFDLTEKYVTQYQIHLLLSSQSFILTSI